MEVSPAACGDRPGSTSLMLSGDTEPRIMLAAMSSWLCSLATRAVFSSSCRHHNKRQRCSCTSTMQRTSILQLQASQQVSALLLHSYHAAHMRLEWRCGLVRTETGWQATPLGRLCSLRLNALLAPIAERITHCSVESSSLLMYALGQGKCRIYFELYRAM